MNALAFVPVSSHLNDRGGRELPALPLPPTQPNQGHACAFALRLGDDGGLVSEPITDWSVPNRHNDASFAALLYRKADGAHPSWMLIAGSKRIGLNGQAPTLPIAAVEPGDLLTIGESGWLVSSLWSPQALTAPADVRDKPCPVCGGELGFAQVVQCACGRWSHLENPADADDPNALNCFLKAGVCGECGRRASLEPQIVPAVPATLAKERHDFDV
jgi:hypothetical protein